MLKQTVRQQQTFFVYPSALQTHHLKANMHTTSHNILICANVNVYLVL